MRERVDRLAPIRLALALALAGWLCLASAQSIAYTVQVVALSDREAALGIQTDLLRQGFPAYVVRSTSNQGDVFRVRVGAFADRAATVLYAAGMPEIGGGQPVPALAEGIPAGITPLAPVLLWQQAVPDGATIQEWQGGLALRIPAREGPAEYVLIGGLDVERHSAYQLGEVDGARLWVRETLLWPPTWQEESEAVRDGFMTSLIGLLAERLGIAPEAVEAAAFRPTEDAAPRVIVVELEAPAEPDGVKLLGLGLPESGMGEFGPLEYLGIAADELPSPPPATQLGELMETPPEAVEAEGFVAAADDSYSLLQAGGRTWRAVAGVPLWTDGEHLLASLGGDLLIYGFVPR
ncbi:MAG TPA: SPOR domain-containing protein [Trueperaceae bacterium]